MVNVGDVELGDEASGERVSGGWFATPRARNETRESSWMMERHRPRGVSGVGSNRVVESVGECRRMLAGMAFAGCLNDVFVRGSPRSC